LRVAAWLTLIRHVGDAGTILTGASDLHGRPVEFATCLAKIEILCCRPCGSTLSIPIAAG